MSWWRNLSADSAPTATCARFAGTYRRARDDLVERGVSCRRRPSDGASRIRQPGSLPRGQSRDLADSVARPVSVTTSATSYERYVASRSSAPVSSSS